MHTASAEHPLTAQLAVAARDAAEHEGIKLRADASASSLPSLHVKAKFRPRLATSPEPLRHSRSWCDDTQVEKPKVEYFRNA